MLKFICYSGKYPNLCSGILVVEKNGKRYGLENILSSGGNCYFTNDYADAHVETGRWEISKECLPKELQEDYYELLELVNENVEWGCCGGCI